MRRFYTTVLELHTNLSDGDATEPYECAWASEAIFFVEIEEEPQSPLFAVVQLSPDGIRWVDDRAPQGPLENGMNAIKTDHFGGWLRLRFLGEGRTVATVRLVLKE